MSLWNRPTRIVCAACKGAFNFFGGDWVKERDRYRCPAVCPHCDRVFDLFCTYDELLPPGKPIENIPPGRQDTWAGALARRLGLTRGGK